MDRESGLWVPASQHAEPDHDEYESDEEQEVASETRGREHDGAVAA